MFIKENINAFSIKDEKNYRIILKISQLRRKPLNEIINELIDIALDHIDYSNHDTLLFEQKNDQEYCKKDITTNQN